MPKKKDGLKPVLVPLATAVVTALLVGLGPAVWKRLLPDKPGPGPPIEYKVAVYSAGEKNPPLARANVEVRLDGLTPVAHETDPQGVATFTLDSVHANKPGKMRVTHKTFEPSERAVIIPLSSAQESVYLDPASAPAPLTPETKVYSSGPKESGLGAGWSGPYELCSQPTPQGYAIGAVQFELRGDRSCGAWSECRESRRTPDIVCWTFRLQGHSEWFPPRPAFSEGILHVTFTPTSRPSRSP